MNALPRLRPGCLLVAALLLWACPAAALEIFCFHLPYGVPAGTPDTNILVIREIYALSANPATKFADWVAYRLDRATVTGDARTGRDWSADPWLPDTATLEPDDFRDAFAKRGTDRGHQAPLGSFKGTDHWQTTNYLSNITPQRSALNQGPWNALEEQERVLAREMTIYVVTGPLYEQPMPELPTADETHTVPSGYWKIIAATDSAGALHCSAYIFAQNTPRQAVFRDHLCTVDEVEARSGLDFFTALYGPEEELLESGCREFWRVAPEN